MLNLLHDDALDGPLDMAITAFWQQVRWDLEHGCAETRAWLDSPDFTAWAAVSLPSVPPARAHDLLLNLWRPDVRVA